MAEMENTVEQAGWLSETVGVRFLEVAILRVEGEDAREWLNGQVTNDVRTTGEGEAVYALVVDVKGKILGDTWVLDRGGNAFDLIVERDCAASLMEHFDKYIVMEDVDLSMRETTIATAQGPRASQLGEGEAAFPCDRMGLGGLDLLEPPGDLIDRARALGGGEVGSEAWELVRHRSGRPAFGLDFDHEHYPQEAGLGTWAVSFEKGCYLGQEVICMLENRGQLRRRLVELRGDGNVEAGAPLSVDGQEVGQMRSSVLDPADGRVRAFGYVKRAHARMGVTVDGPGGTLTVSSVVGESATGDPGSTAL